MQQRERVRARAGGRDAVQLPRGQVGGGREPGDVRRPRARDRAVLMGAPRPHLDARPVTGDPRHPRRGGGDRGVVVVDREQQGLEQHRLGERPLDHEQRRVREVHLTLGVTPDLAAEAVRRQPVAGRLVDDVLQRLEHLVVEAELLQGVERPADAGHHAVPSTLRKPAREELEDRTALGSSGAEGRLEHGQLVVVGEQRGRGGHGPSVGGGEWVRLCHHGPHGDHEPGRGRA